MTTYAVDERVKMTLTSGAVPLLARDTAPSEHQQTHLPAPTMPISRPEGNAAIEEAVTPIRPPSARERATDLMKVTVPLPFTVTIVMIAIAVAAAVWRIESQINVINAAIMHERELDGYREKNLLQLVETLRAEFAFAAKQAASKD